MDEVLRLPLQLAGECGRRSEDHLQLTRKLRFTTPNSGRRSLWIILYSFIESNNSRMSEETGQSGWTSISVLIGCSVFRR